MDFPPVRNGIDYLVSVVERLDENESAVDERDLKYAVLHLQAAVEVLLKARLLREHWSLVFKEPGRATRAAYESGDFESCGTLAAVERLREIVGVSIEKKDVDELKELAKARNALQHYGLTQPSQAVEARAGRVLDFLMRFLEAELLPLLQGTERLRAEREMRPVADGVKNISSYVKRRISRLRGELGGLEGQTVLCPVCEQMALVVVPGGGRCHFCNWEWDDAWIFSGYEPEDCPDCESVALLQGVAFADSPTVFDGFYCFMCSARYAPNDLVRCSNCDRPWPIEADVEGTASTLCQTCREHITPEEIA